MSGLTPQVFMCMEQGYMARTVCAKLGISQDSLRAQVRLVAAHLRFCRS